MKKHILYLQELMEQVRHQYIIQYIITIISKKKELILMK